MSTIVRWGNLFARARIAASTLKGAARAVLFNVERATDDETEKAAEQPGFSALGVYGRPEPPTKKSDPILGEGECETIATRPADGILPLVYRDLRISVRVNPKVGDVGIAQYGGGYLSLQWDRDRRGTVVSLSAPRLDSSGAVTEAHYLSMDPSDAENSITLAHRSGHGLFLTKEGEAKLMSPDGKKWILVSDEHGVEVVSDRGMAFGGGIIAGSTDQAQAMAIAQPYIDLLTELLAALAATFAGPAPTPAPGVPLSAAWAASQIAPLQAKLALLSTMGTSQTLKASPT